MSETYECDYCNAEVEDGKIPAVDDDAKWAALAEEHAAGCEWVADRAGLRLSAGEVATDRAIRAIELPLRLHPAYDWTDAAGELDGLRALDGDELDEYCRESAANWAESWDGTESAGVSEADLHALSVWLKERAGRALGGQTMTVTSRVGSVEYYEARVAEIAADTSLSAHARAAALDLTAVEISRACWSRSAQDAAGTVADRARRLADGLIAQGGRPDFLDGMDELAARGLLKLKAE
jgi:hypothetical protein